MENNQSEQEKMVKQLYTYAADLKFNQNMSYIEIRKDLIDKGLEPEVAATIAGNLENHVAATPKKSGSTKDILIGGFFLIAGLIGTFSGTGYIFYGAIIFGGIQLIQGLVSKA